LQRKEYEFRKLSMLLNLSWNLGCGQYVFSAKARKYTLAAALLKCTIFESTV